MLATLGSGPNPEGEAKMNAAMVFRVVSLIPDRVARLPSGTVFSAAEAGTCRYPERFAHLARFLHWLGPLSAITREEQQLLGLRAANGRPIHAADIEDEPGELEDAEVEVVEVKAAEVEEEEEADEFADPGRPVDVFDDEVEDTPVSVPESRESAWL